MVVGEGYCKFGQCYYYDVIVWLLVVVCEIGGQYGKYYQWCIYVGVKGLYFELEQDVGYYVGCNIFGDEGENFFKVVGYVDDNQDYGCYEVGFYYFWYVYFGKEI